MSKKLYIAEKPSVAIEFAKALKTNTSRRDGYLESEDSIFTWCVGHLVTMSYPDAYDPKLKSWRLESLPFLPKEFRYEIIPAVNKQFKTVKSLLNREDINTIYVCTDSGREGEYIYRLVDQMAKVSSTKTKKRVWIDSQTEDEINRGIREAKLLSDYDNLAASAYLRAKEDYLMGINFTRIISIKYGATVNDFFKSKKWSAIAVGRVMTCVQGMVVRRERDIRDFVKTPFYRLFATIQNNNKVIKAEFKAIEGSKYFNSNLLYKDNGFLELAVAQKEIEYLVDSNPLINEDGNWESQAKSIEDVKVLAEVANIERKKENRNPPLLYNLAELQNDCSRVFKISPDKTLEIAQDLYEKKLITYPRTDARVLSTAVAKEINKNISGFTNLYELEEIANEILKQGQFSKISKSRYVNDKQISDHYAIIPTGQGMSSLKTLSPLSYKVYMAISKRFLAIFYPPAVYRKVSINFKIKDEYFVSNFKFLESEGYLKVVNYKRSNSNNITDENKDNDQDEAKNNEENVDEEFIELISSLKRGSKVPVQDISVKEGETTPPKRYNSGTLILAMENAGQLIEDEELRSHIKGSGIGTSATRAEILKKLVKINYLYLNGKTQVVTPTLHGEIIFDVVNMSIRSLLNPELTASWEKGLTLVADGKITSEEYMKKLEDFVSLRVNNVKASNYENHIKKQFNYLKKYYK
ncbi:MAG TPA: type IA DNA topoisomerase [Clostridiales bacterium]|nr:type IA DNA topoisomerase [Clostridiales bacterium]